MYRHVEDAAEARATNSSQDASQEAGVSLQWSIAADIADSNTFLVRRCTSA